MQQLVPFFFRPASYSSGGTSSEQTSLFRARALWAAFTRRPFIPFSCDPHPRAPAARELGRRHHVPSSSTLRPKPTSMRALSLLSLGSTHRSSIEPAFLPCSVRVYSQRHRARGVCCCPCAVRAARHAHNDTSAQQDAALRNPAPLSIKQAAGCSPRCGDRTGPARVCCVDEGARSAAHGDRHDAREQGRVVRWLWLWQRGNGRWVCLRGRALS